MEGKDLTNFVKNCLEWIRHIGYMPDFRPGAPGWMHIATGVTITSGRLYELYLIEVIKQSTNEQ